MRPSILKSQCRDHDFESSSLSDETRNVGLKVKTETETEKECKYFVKIYGLKKGILWSLVPDLCMILSDTSKIVLVFHIVY